MQAQAVGPGWRGGECRGAGDIQGQCLLEHWVRTLYRGPCTRGYRRYPGDPVPSDTDVLQGTRRERLSYTGFTDRR